MADFEFGDKTEAFDQGSALEALVGLAAQGVIETDQIDAVLDDMFGQPDHQ